jgi:hypothetical protein
MSLSKTIRHLIIGRLRWLAATGDQRDAEILALCHQIVVLERVGAGNSSMTVS